jgi:CheY-like chemotaxis protein
MFAVARTRVCAFAYPSNFGTVKRVHRADDRGMPARQEVDASGCNNGVALNQGRAGIPLHDAVLETSRAVQAAFPTARTPIADGANLGSLVLQGEPLMRRVSAPGSSAPSGLLGILRSWLNARSHGVWQASEDQPSAAESPNAHCYGPVRLLVVDDNPVNLMVVSTLMESRGLVPLLAADGAEAVALACELHFDLILMDLQMPILDGLGATSAIRRFEAEGGHPAVPVVAYSSASPGPRVLTAHGLNGSLSKPCGDQELEDCLVRWCPTYRPAPADEYARWPAAAQSLEVHRVEGVRRLGTARQASRVP